jgi:hypothetical protein
MGLRIIYAVGAAILIGALQFFVGLGGNAFAIIAAGVLLGLFPYGVWALLEAEEQLTLDLYLPGLAGGGGVLGGSVLRWLAKSPDTMPFDLLACLLCVAGGTMIAVGRARRGRYMCPLRCGRRVTSQNRWCPRCEQIVCGRSSCWNMERYCCAQCEWLQRPLFPLEDEGWWRQHFGERVSEGACQECRCSAAARPLYECGHCRWPMCTLCWDFENGRCVRSGCDWFLPDLPENLRAHLAAQVADAHNSSVFMHADSHHV